MTRYEDVLPLAPKKRGWRSFIWRHLLAVTTTLLVALLMIVVLWPYVVITVPSRLSAQALHGIPVNRLNSGHRPSMPRFSGAA
jgi:hypothetical protein